MNPVAITAMAGLAVGFIAALMYALSVGAGWAVALLAILAIALFVRWR